MKLKMHGHNEKLMSVPKMISISTVLLLTILVFAGTPGISDTHAESGQDICILRIDGPIVPAIVDYIDRCICDAESRQATIILIELNTPGGLYSSTQEIVKRILITRIPVVVYVSPAGGWAGSAGTFITLAAHVAVMAPGSRIGAAHPVGATPGDLPKVQGQKITEDAAAWIRSIAQMRGRNPKNAELAVRESKSYSDEEALAAGLIDLRSVSEEKLLEQLQGREVILSTGEKITLQLDNKISIRYQMNFIERFLTTISEPNIAYLLMTIGMTGIIAELYHPGIIFPGVIGGLSLLTAVYALGALNAYWVGVLLTMLSFGLFVGEVFAPTHGAMAFGGIISLIMGSLMLFSGTPFQVSRWLIGTMATVMGCVFALLISVIVRTQQRLPATGLEGLLGKTGLVQIALDPTGIVFIEGERWHAIAAGGEIIKPGEEVIIKEIHGLRLMVQKKGGKTV